MLFAFWEYPEVIVGYEIGLNETTIIIKCIGNGAIEI